METEVLIVGAGPVGLMLACQLALRQVPFRILEQKSARQPFCKALGISPRSLEIFDQMGLLDEARCRGIFFGALNTVVDGQLVRRLVAQSPGLPYGFMGMAQPDCESMLEEYLWKSGVRVERDRQLVSLLPKSDRVIVKLADGSQVEAGYLVGCDGAHSCVRKSLGIGFEGERFQLTFVLGDLHLQWDRPHAENWQFQRSLEGGGLQVVTVIANPTGPSRYRISTTVDEGFECSDNPTLEELQSLLLPALPEGTVLSDLRWSSRYSVSHRIASEYSRGRVFLAGDAAHIHPPIGGLGMNTGMQDAHNLGWKLAMVSQGILPAAMLDSYQSERLPVGQRVVAVTGARMRRAMGEEDSTPDPPGFDTQLGVRYSQLGGQEAPQAGQRLPWIDGLQRPWCRGQLRLAELFRSGSFLLFLCGVDSAGFQSKAASLFGQHLQCWTLASQDPGLPGGWLLDSEEHWLRTIGPGAVLVRPDGFLAWRGQTVDEFMQWAQGYL